MSNNQHIVIIGAGPTGLGAAWRLQELGHSKWTLVEAADGPGGLATSIVDEQGFTWDLGGHVLFSHYSYFDQLMNEALGDNWCEHDREAWVWMRDRWIPYPFQNNIWRLPDDDLIACLEGLLEVSTFNGQIPPKNFKDWLEQSFGKGLCDTFMFPYNFKVWAYEPERMNVEWMGERVAKVDFARILRNLVLKKDDVSWGPNSRFRFPLKGGTGAIWSSIANKLPAERQLYGKRVTSVNPHSKTIILDNGEVLSYDLLISTMPLDQLLLILEDCSDVAKYAEEFIHSSTHIVGIGIDGKVPEELATKCWMYFPESTSPFYRATVFSNYSPNNVPKPTGQWSLMCETSESPAKPVDERTIVDETLAGLHASRLISADNKIISRWHRRLEYGYPTPWIGRDGVIESVQSKLARKGVYSRGRFGAWKYEVANQDHSLMQGVEVVNKILKNELERTINGDMSDR